ncbi:uncharacterized protein LOC129593212 [Paramacrobiotus metropolitanus]|uniref:uncharacterized protein LOC129593212 n=1 Tax=Paramacrobiotus metropolitanus TaxID=2943436 RepID=UPI00244648B8|nr:uncharacterized protein LOC129593212 [Paramacrobiotus metropolitanus]
MADKEWRSEVVEKLKAIVTDPKEYAEIARFLAAEEDKMNGYKKSGIWKILYDVVDSDKYFLSILRSIKSETESKSPRSVDHSLITPDVRHKWGHPDITDLAVCGAMGGASGLAAFPATQASILPVVQILVSPALMPIVQQAADVVKAMGRRAPVALAAVYLSWEAMRTISHWWNGKISGRRVAKSLVDQGVTVAAGCGAAVAGAALGGLLGPVGALAGGVIGSLVGGSTAAFLVDWLTQNLFDIPKDEAVENAYSFLGCTRSSTNKEINDKYHAACLKHHPDKGGDVEMFRKLQNCMGVIKVARGEQYGATDEVRYLEF